MSCSRRKTMHNPISLFKRDVYYFLVKINETLSHILSIGNYYSQCGEDVILSAFFRGIGIKDIYYVDIGANRPIGLSNTFFFYKQGGKGICVEPNETLARELKKIRKRDKVICKGIGVDASIRSAKYYRMKCDLLNTFSKSEAEEYKRKGVLIDKIEDKDIVYINDLLKETREIDLLSIDVEGLDFDIIKAINFDIFLPKTICLETKEFKGGRRADYYDINRFLATKQYTILFETDVNTIYVQDSLAKKWIASQSDT
jgi:FkbM family methyltransferase